MTDLIKKGDTVLFTNGTSNLHYQAATDTYEMEDGRLVVDLTDYADQVPIQYLAKVLTLFPEDFQWN